MQQCIYYDKCSKCGGEYKSMSGFTVDTFPAFYPVKCILCGEEAFARLKIEVEATMFNKNKTLGGLNEE